MSDEANPLARRVGRRIKQLRREKGWKQEALALEAGYGSRSAIASIEVGQVLPSLDKAIDIARVLGVSLSEILDDQREEQSFSATQEEQRLISTLLYHAQQLPPEVLRHFADMAEAVLQMKNESLSSKRRAIVAQLDALTPFLPTLCYASQA